MRRAGHERNGGIRARGDQQLNQTLTVPNWRGLVVRCAAGVVKPTISARWPPAALSQSADL
jgi:hypothetical protein